MDGTVSVADARYPKEGVEKMETAIFVLVLIADGLAIWRNLVRDRPSLILQLVLVTIFGGAFTGAVFSLVG